MPTGLKAGNLGKQRDNKNRRRNYRELWKKYENMYSYVKDLRRWLEQKQISEGTKNELRINRKETGRNGTCVWTWKGNGLIYESFENLWLMYLYKPARNLGKYL